MVVVVVDGLPVGWGWGGVAEPRCSGVVVAVMVKRSLLFSSGRVFLPQETIWCDVRLCSFTKVGNSRVVGL